MISSAIWVLRGRSTFFLKKNEHGQFIQVSILVSTTKERAPILKDAWIGLFCVGNVLTRSNNAGIENWPSKVDHPTYAFLCQRGFYTSTDNIIFAGLRWSMTINQTMGTWDRVSAGDQTNWWFLPHNQLRLKFHCKELPSRDFEPLSKSEDKIWILNF